MHVKGASVSALPSFGVVPSPTNGPSGSVELSFGLVKVSAFASASTVAPSDNIVPSEGGAPSDDGAGDGVLDVEEHPPNVTAANAATLKVQPDRARNHGCGMKRSFLRSGGYHSRSSASIRRSDALRGMVAERAFALDHHDRLKLLPRGLVGHPVDVAACEDSPHFGSTPPVSGRDVGASPAVPFLPPRLHRREVNGASVPRVHRS